MRGRHKAWAAPYLLEHTETVYEKVPESDGFLSSPLFLEIGIGKGDFILGMAAKKGGHWLGLERDLSIMGIAAKKAVESGIENIRLRAADFDFAYEELVSHHFDAVYLNFSDPWPKKKHWKRRLTTRGRLTKMGALIDVGSKIFIKTDNDALYAFTLEEAPFAGFRIEVNEPEYEFDAENDAMSEYERNFREKGQPIHRIVLVKEKDIEQGE